MTEGESIAEIETQKERGRRLLSQVQQIHVGRNNYGDGMAVFGPPPMYYTPKEELEPIQNEYVAWKCYVHDFLQSVLDKDDDIFLEWNKCLQEPYRLDVSDKEWYTKEIKEALGKLDSFIQRIGFRLMDKEADVEHFDFLSALHPRVVELVKDRFDAGHYSDALLAASKDINVIVKAIVLSATGKEQDGPSLMRTAFKQDSPVLKLNSLSTQTEKDEQQGYCDLCTGAMEAFRNPMSHENIELTKVDAIRKLLFVSLLMYKICPVA